MRLYIKQQATHRTKQCETTCKNTLTLRQTTNWYTISYIILCRKVTIHGYCINNNIQQYYMTIIITISLLDYILYPSARLRFDRCSTSTTIHCRLYMAGNDGDVI